MDPSTIPLPPMKDLTDANITPNAILIHQNTPSPRLKFLLTHLITHLHDFARETRLTTAEWTTAIDFLTRTGQISSPTRSEFILLSDILGLSTLVEGINHPKPPGATEGTVLGPFHTQDALEVEQGGSIASEGKGEVCLVRCSVYDAVTRKPLSGAKIDIWETDHTGQYDTQYQNRMGPDCRGIITSDAEGRFWFKAVKPVSYSIPADGPVGELLRATKRHACRPSHMHFMVMAEGYDPLITALYVRGDPYETTDAVFGVKESLVVDVKWIDDQSVLREYGLPKGGCWGIEYGFGMVGVDEAQKLKVEKAMKALKELGSRARIVDGLPVAELD